MKKTCFKCNTSKSVDLFNKRSKSKDGLNSWCKSCLAEYERLRYHGGDKERKAANRIKSRDKNRARLWELLSSSKCKDCGNDDPEVLEFDHRDPSQKEFNVSEMIWYYSWDNMLKEIAKCDILCANCHKKKTIRQFGMWRGDYGV